MSPLERVRQPLLTPYEQVRHADTIWSSLTSYSPYDYVGRSGGRVHTDGFSAFGAKVYFSLPEEDHIREDLRSRRRVTDAEMDRGLATINTFREKEYIAKGIVITDEGGLRTINFDHNSETAGEEVTLTDAEKDVIKRMAFLFTLPVVVVEQFGGYQKFLDALGNRWNLAMITKGNQEGGLYAHGLINAVRALERDEWGYNWDAMAVAETFATKLALT